jgi:hypothetical protein
VLDVKLPTTMESAKLQFQDKTGAAPKQIRLSHRPADPVVCRPRGRPRQGHVVHPREGRRRRTAIHGLHPQRPHRRHHRGAAGALHAPDMADTVGLAASGIISKSSRTLVKMLHPSVDVERQHAAGDQT